MTDFLDPFPPLEPRGCANKAMRSGSFREPPPEAAAMLWISCTSVVGHPKSSVAIWLGQTLGQPSPGTSLEAGTLLTELLVDANLGVRQLREAHVIFLVVGQVVGGTRFFLKTKENDPGDLIKRKFTCLTYFQK